MVIEQASDKKLDDYQYDGNHCIGPVKKMTAVPRPRLEMVAPAAAEQPTAPAPAEQLA